MSIDIKTHRAADQPPAYNLDEECWKKAKLGFRSSQPKDKHEKVEKFLKTWDRPESVKTICAEMKKDAASEYSPRLGKFLEKVEIFMTMGDLAIGKGAPESVGLAWMGVRMCLSALEDDYSTFGIFFAAASDIVGIIISCKAFAKMYGSTQGESVKEFEDVQREATNEIPIIYEAVLNFSWEIKKYKSTNAGLRGAKSLFRSASTKFAAQVESIKQHENKMAKFATRAHEQLMHHYRNTSLANQAEVQSQLASIDASLQKSQALNESLAADVKALRAAVANLRLTPEEIAKRNYEDNQRKLNATSDQARILDDKLAKRKSPSTCTWIFGADEYQRWYGSEKSSVLWVSGSAGHGKSVLMSAVIKELQAHAYGIYNLCYFFCQDGDEATRDKDRKDRIFQHLLSQLYETFETEPWDVMEKANKLFAIDAKSGVTGKGEGSQMNAQKDTKGSSKGFDTAEALSGLSRLSERPLFLVIDAIDECDEVSRKDVISEVKSIISKTDIHVRVLVSSRPDVQGLDTLERCERINMEERNKADIRIAAQTELATLPGWTTAERALACDRIADRAESFFRYVDLAIDFLKRPWKRPLAQHLEHLPGGMNDFYDQIVASTDPAYSDLLKTCLTWTFLANDDMHVEEVIDAYTQVYAVEGEAEEVAEVEVANNSDEQSNEGDDDQEIENEEGRLYVEQISKAAASLLEVLPSKRPSQAVIQPRHKSVKDHFLAARETATSKKQRESDVHSCATCQKLVRDQAPFVVDARHGHMIMATTILRHVLNPSFRRRHMLQHEKPSDAETPGWAQDRPKLELIPLNAEKKVPEEQPEDMNTAPENTSSVGNKVAKDDTDTSPSRSEAQVSQTQNPEEQGEKNREVDHQDSTEDSEQIKDDQSDIDSLGSDDDLDDEPGRYADLDEQPSVHSSLRYEITNCGYHLAMVEKYWFDQTHDDPAWLEFAKLRRRLAETDSPARRSLLSVLSGWEGCLWNSVADIASVQNIHYAAASGLTTLVDELLCDENKYAPTSEGETVLNYAIRYYGNAKDDENPNARLNAVRLLTLLMERGVNPNQINTRTQWPPLMHLLFADPHAEVVELFLKHGADIDVVAPNYKVGVMNVCCLTCSKPETFRLLLERGADPNMKDLWGETPLHQLVRRDAEGVVELVNIMIEYKASIDEEDLASQRPLYELCSYSDGNRDVAEVLINNGADVHDDDLNKATALHMACLRGNVDLVRLLLQKGAKLTQDDMGRTPFFLACGALSEATALAMITEFPQECEAVLNQPNKDGKTPLQRACAYGYLRLVETLFDKLGGDSSVLNAVDSKMNRTALHFAVRSGRTDVVDFLLKRDADVRIKDRNDRTPLALAFASWKEARVDAREKICLALLEAENIYKISADAMMLHRAAARGSTKLLDMLLRQGLDPSVKDEHGWTSLDIARHYGHEDVVTSLKAYEAAAAAKPSRLMDVMPKAMHVSEGGLKSVFRSDPHKLSAASVRADHPIPIGVTSYYYEVQIDSPPREDSQDPPEIAIGLCLQPTKSLRQWIPGWVGLPGWAYHGDYAGLWAETTRGNNVDIPLSGLPKYGNGDIIGCGIDLVKHSMFYTKNGELLQVDVKSKPLTHYAFPDVAGRLYPVMGTSTQETSFLVNFGNDKDKPFLWAPANEESDLAAFVAKEEARLPKALTRKATTRSLTLNVAATNGEAQQNGKQEKDGKAQEQAQDGKKEDE